MHKRRGYNPKRKLADLARYDPGQLKQLAERARYGGSPEHKMRPNDYGLTPNRGRRAGKSLCDVEREFPKADAERLLKEGMKRAMVSQQAHNGWPQNVWAVMNGTAFEAQLENREHGVYHGYPMPADDDFQKVVVEEWARRV